MENSNKTKEDNFIHRLTPQCNNKSQHLSVKQVGSISCPPPRIPWENAAHTICHLLGHQLHVSIRRPVSLGLE